MISAEKRTSQSAEYGRTLAQAEEANMRGSTLVNDRAKLLQTDYSGVDAAYLADLWLQGSGGYASGLCCRRCTIAWVSAVVREQILW